VTQIINLQRLIGGAMLAAIIVLGGCARLSGPGQAPTTVSLRDMPYDRSTWRWVNNPDGRQLLAHSKLQKCFIDPQPGLEFNDPALTLKREEKTIGGARYEVFNVFEQQTFWSAVYTRAGMSAPVLEVYSEGACRDAAERILQAYENARGK
jgi:hypothetical protein